MCLHVLLVEFICISSPMIAHLSSICCVDLKSVIISDFVVV